MFSYRPSILSTDGVDWRGNALSYAALGEAEEYLVDFKCQLDCHEGD